MDRSEPSWWVASGRPQRSLRAMLAVSVMIILAHCGEGNPEVRDRVVGTYEFVRTRELHDVLMRGVEAEDEMGAGARTPAEREAAVAERLGLMSGNLTFHDSGRFNATLHGILGEDKDVLYGEWEFREGVLTLTVEPSKERWHPKVLPSGDLLLRWDIDPDDDYAWAFPDLLFKRTTAGAVGTTSPSD